MQVDDKHIHDRDLQWLREADGESEMHSEAADAFISKINP